MKNSATSGFSFFAARATLTDIDKRLWNHVGSSNLRKIVPKHAANFGKKTLKKYIEESEVKGENKQGNLEEISENMPLKEGMLTCAAEIQSLNFYKNNLERHNNTLSQTESRKKNQSQKSKFFTRSKTSNKSHQNWKRSKNISDTKSQTKSKTLKYEQSQQKFYQIPTERGAQKVQIQFDPIIEKLRSNKELAQAKQQEQQRLKQLKSKMKVERENFLRKKLKEMNGFNFDYQGQIIQRNNEPPKILKPEVSVTLSVIEGQQILETIGSGRRDPKKNIIQKIMEAQRKKSRNYEKQQKRFITEVNQHLNKNDSQSETRLFGTTLDSQNSISEGVRIKQVNTTLLREKPLKRKGNMKTLGDYQEEISCKKFRSFEKRISRIKTLEKEFEKRVQDDERQLLNEESLAKDKNQKEEKHQRSIFRNQTEKKPSKNKSLLTANSKAKGYFKGNQKITISSKYLFFSQIMGQ